MNINRCPKCNAHCELSEGNVYLGTLVECPECGCKFEIVKTREGVSSPRFRLQAEPVVEPEARIPTETVRPPTPKGKPRIAWKSFAILLAIWSGLALFFQLAIITFTFPASLILMAFFRTNRTLYKKAQLRNFVYFSLDKGFEIFVSLTIVAAFYLVASWLFDGSSDQSTLGYLWQLEDRFSAFKNFLSKYVIFKPWISALLIAILIVVDLVYAYVVGFDATAAEKPKSLVSRYLAFQRFSRRAYVALAVLCSFTFFGNAVAGEKIARVQVKIEEIRSGYEEAQKATEEALIVEVQQRLLDEIDDTIAFPRSYQPRDYKYYHDIVYTSHERVESLRQTYADATATADVNLDPALQARVKEVTGRRSPAYDGPREVPYADNLGRESVGATEKPSRAESRPANLKELTFKKVEEVNKSFQKSAELRRSISAIKLADGTEILVQLPKSFTKVAKGVAFHELTARFPFLEPIINGLVTAFDKTMEERIKTKVSPKLDKLLARWFPGDTVLPTDFKYEAEDLVKESRIIVPEAVASDTKAAAGDFNKAIAECDRLIGELNSQVEIARVRNQPPPPPIDVNALPEASCPATALKNYLTRLARAKNSGERTQAMKTYSSDIARLEEQQRLMPRAKPG